MFVVNDDGPGVQVSIDGGTPRAVDSLRKLWLAEGAHHAAVTGPVSDEFDFQMRTPYMDRWLSKPVWVLNVKRCVLRLYLATAFRVSGGSEVIAAKTQRSSAYGHSISKPVLRHDDAWAGSHVWLG